MIKAIFFDIDGTLLDHSPKGGGRIPPSTLRCLEALRKKGIKLFVATGRIPAMVTFLEDLFPFDGFVTLNGQLALDREGRVLHRMAHHPQDIRKLAELVEADPFPCLVIEEKDSFFMVETPIIREHFQKEGLSAPGSYHIARLEEHPILQFLAYIPKEEAQRRLASLEHIEITSAGGTILDIIPKEGGKEVGIQAVADRYGWQREELLVFGDGDNDARMLSWAAHSVALGNGTPAAKASRRLCDHPRGRGRRAERPPPFRGADGGGTPRGTGMTKAGWNNQPAFYVPFLSFMSRPPGDSACRGRGPFCRCT